MRKIEFRVYSYSLQKMLSVMHILHTDRTEPEIWSGDFEGGLRLMAGDFELMQFTGLRDDKGCEVYEGDILRVAPDDDPDDFYLAPVIWGGTGYPAFDLDYKHIPQDIGYEANALSTIWSGDTDEIATVVGNIYQNPELLEERDEQK